MLQTLIGLILLIDFAEAGTPADPSSLPVSIKYDGDYQALPTCINQCLWDISDDDTGPLGGNLGYHLNCTPPWLNGCYCVPPASASRAYNFITSCVDYLCATPARDDIASGTSLYDAYCAEAMGAGFGDSPTQQEATTTQDLATQQGRTSTADPRAQGGISTSVGGQYSTKSPTRTAESTKTAEPTKSSDGPGGLDTSDKIALGVGIGIGLPATLGTLWMCLKNL